MKIVFMGTAELAVASLNALQQCAEWKVVAVVTQPDRPQGRSLQPKPSPVKVAAQAAGLPVLQPEKLREPGSVQVLRDLSPDLVVVTAYGQILPQSVLDLPRWGCLNIHTSLLPKYRGAAPIQWALLNGEAETGVTLMLMDAGLDTGPILRQRATPISPDDDAPAIHDRLATLGGELLRSTIPDWVAGKLSPTPQPGEGVSYARKIEKSDGWLDWTLPSIVLWNRVRGLTPWPGAFCHRLVEGERRVLKVWQASPEPATHGDPGEVIAVGTEGILIRCGEGALRLRSLQRDGGKRLTASQFLAGQPMAPGEHWPTENSNSEV